MKPISPLNGPLVAKDAEPDDDSLLCHYSTAPVAADGEFMYMPAGEHAITPSQNGKPVVVRVMVDRASAAALEAQRAAIVARNQRPYFDFNHEDGEASFWPTEFFWKDSPAPGIYTRGEWTGPGEAAIKGKSWRYFSPVFHVDNTRANPARIACRVHAKANMGGLVNDPAFKNISPLWARNADGAQSISTNKDNMNEKELEALREKNAGLEKDIKDLKDQQASLKAKAESDTVVASQISAKEAELKLGLKEIENEQLKAKNAGLESAEKARREADADKAIADAVARGAIAAKDEDAKASWKALLVADPNNSALLAKMAGNPALEQKRMTTSATRVERGQISGIEAVSAYAALVARNASIKTVADPAKARLAKEAAALFASEMKGNEDSWMGVPLDHEALKAADVSSASIGTLAGTLVLQRNLPLLKYSYPMLQTLFTDFSDTVGLWGQTEKTRIPIKPAVTEYDATPDANGRPKGFVVVVPAQAVDVDITLSKHVGIPMVFGVQTLASTVRNLFAEQSAGAINALGGYFVNMATALMTAANFNAYKQITDAGCETVTGSVDIVLASTAGVYPGQEISGAGIPAGTHIASVVDGTHATMTLAATATATVVATLGGGRVPVLYPTYAKAAADFDFASLGEIGAAFDTNEVPLTDRFAMLNAAYYQRLAQDPICNSFFAAVRSPEIVNKGQLPELNGFVPQKAPFFPATNNRVGFAYYRAALALKARLPQDFTRAVTAMVPGSVTTVTDPDMNLSVLHVERVDLVGRYAESSIEAMLGAAVGDRRAGLVLTSQ